MFTLGHSTVSVTGYSEKNLSVKDVRFEVFMTMKI